MKPDFKKYRIPKTLQLLFIGVLTFNVLWLFFSLIFQNKALPNPIYVYEIMPKTIAAGMGEHIWASLRRVLIGTSISLFFGLIGGMLTALSKKANRIFEPLLYLSYPIPKLALLPIIMIVFGIGETTKIVMIILIIVFQLMISIRDAVRRIPKENYYVLSSLGAGKLQYTHHVILPGILPDVFSALRITVGIAISVLFVTETFGTDKGLGFFIVDAWMRLDYLTMYAGIVAISIIGFLLFLVIDVADAVFCRWDKIRSRNSP
ncbi:MAG: ABC transporter permease [Porphyromonadaceae bacterium]|nr:ABC transporter permease [Porphyromonadaceae bacterium]